MTQLALTAARYAADDHAAATRAAYLAAMPAFVPLDVYCPTCSAEPRRSCLTGRQSVLAHPDRVDLAARYMANRDADAERAAEAARVVYARLAAGTPANRVSRYLDREGRRSYLIAYGWRHLYCTASSPWRSPYTQMPDRYSMAFAFAWTMQEHAVFAGPDGMSGVCVTCKQPSAGRDRFGLARCAGCATSLGVAA